MQRPVSKKVTQDEKMAALAFWAVKIANAAQTASSQGPATFAVVLGMLKDLAMKLDPILRDEVIKRYPESGDKIMGSHPDLREEELKRLVDEEKAVELKLYAMSRQSCTDDADCPEGYFCGWQRHCHPLYEIDEPGTLTLSLPS